jgi:anaphase-promoting complex subunit 2
LTDFRTNKPSDVISTLVSIYDSQDLFVKELQVLLAQRLLAIKDGNFEKEVSHPICSVISNYLFTSVNPQRRNIEILKVRFGESALQVCEVMLKDMTDSQRIDQHVQSQKAVRHPSIAVELFYNLLSQSIVHPTIISRHFWPTTLESSDIVMPGQFQE